MSKPTDGWDAYRLTITSREERRVREEERRKAERLVTALERLDAALDKAEAHIPGETAIVWVAYALQAAADLQRELLIRGSSVSEMDRATVDVVVERFNLVTWRMLHHIREESPEKAELQVEELQGIAKEHTLKLGLDPRNDSPTHGFPILVL